MAVQNLIGSLEILEGQPIVLDPPQDCASCGDICYCQKYALDDYLQWQAKQGPCGDNLLCSDLFSLGDDTIENGSFAGSATGWTLGAGWTYNTNKVNFDGASGSGILSQAQTYVTGTTYVLRFTISNAAEDLVLKIRTSPLGGFDDIATSYPVEDGTYSITFTATAGMGAFIAFDSTSTDPAYDITDISLQEFMGCFDVEDGGWIFDDYACHTPSNTGALVSTLTIIPNRYYKVIIKLSSVTAGTLQIYVGGETVTLSTNGGFIEYIEAGTADNDFKLIPDTDFDGCIESVELYELRKDFKAYLINDQDEIIQDLTQYIEYYKQWVTINKKWSELSGAYVDNCYRLVVLDPCGTIQTTGSELLTNGSFTGSATDWTLGGGATYASNAVDLVGVSTLSQTKVLAADCYLLTFTISDYGGGIITPTVGGVTGNAVAGDGTYQQVFRLPSGGNDVSFATTAGTSATIDNVSLKEATSCYNHTSNCLCYKTSWDCNYLVEGYADNEAFGFEFATSGFKLSQRLAFSLFSAKYPDDSEDYIYSDGTHETYFSQVEKFSEMFVEKAPEYVHDCIALTRRLKHFFLEDANGNMVEYFVKKSDYTPEWVKNSLIREAPARFDVSKKGSVKFMTNCY